MEVEYVIVFEVVKGIVWLKKFLMGLRLVPLTLQPVILFFDNSGMMT